MRYFLLFLLYPTLLTSQEFIVEKLPEFINSNYDEITPVPSRDGNTLYFTRVAYPDFDHTLWLDSVDYALKLQPEAYRKMLAGIYTEIGKTPTKSPETSSFNQDIWVANGDSARFANLTHPGPPLNNALPNSLVSITPDPNAFYIINQFKATGDMNKGFSLIRRLSDNSWSAPDPVEIKDFYTITSDVSLTMSFDGKILILAAARYDSRDLDLYVCFKDGEHQWSVPHHMGNTINSNKRELTPFLSEDHSTLFFASNRWNSSGGLDLFVSRREDDTWLKWSEPVRLTYPINSPEDESQPYFNMTSGYLYFTSQRDGSNDIFRVQIAPPQATELVITGRVLNRKTGELLLGASVRYESESTRDNKVSAENGYYTLKIPKGLAFELTPEKSGFSGKPETILFRRDYYFFQDSYTIDLYADPMEVGSTIALRPIYFQQSKPQILETSFPELKRLADILLENQTMHILVEGHTDNVGKIEDLQTLSEDRAMAVKTFLTEQGVSADRIQANGFGPSQPISDNSTEASKQLNRRVEVKITKL